MCEDGHDGLFEKHYQKEDSEAYGSPVKHGSPQYGVYFSVIGLTEIVAYERIDGLRKSEKGHVHYLIDVKDYCEGSYAQWSADTHQHHVEKKGGKGGRYGCKHFGRAVEEDTAYFVPTSAWLFQRHETCKHECGGRIGYAGSNSSPFHSVVQAYDKDVIQNDVKHKAYQTADKDLVRFACQSGESLSEVRYAEKDNQQNQCAEIIPQIRVNTFVRSEEETDVTKIAYNKYGKGFERQTKEKKCQGSVGFGKRYIAVAFCHGSYDNASGNNHQADREQGIDQRHRQIDGSQTQMPHSDA